MIYKKMLATLGIIAFIMIMPIHHKHDVSDSNMPLGEHLFRSLNEREYIIFLIQKNQNANDYSLRRIASLYPDKPIPDTTKSAIKKRNETIKALREKLHRMTSVDYARINN